ncbi:DUF4429 domain-containing protein [Streptomyces sp. S.PNR 29]|nr:DUF4429 domain-containing protein [Streptomyces sp. S.PNR 29]MDN0195208.1 DUF4429 domain-containing protein [Streptomyces sp. S.PNR 29]
MAEIIQRDGTWAFDGSTVRITPGLHRSVPLFRQTYGEVAVPLEAVAGVAFAPERRHGRHLDGVLTDEEFALTPAAVLRGFRQRSREALTTVSPADPARCG